MKKMKTQQSTTTWWSQSDHGQLWKNIKLWIVTFSLNKSTLAQQRKCESVTWGIFTSCTCSVTFLDAKISWKLSIFHNISICTEEDQNFVQWRYFLQRVTPVSIGFWLLLICIYLHLCIFTWLCICYKTQNNCLLKFPYRPVSGVD